MVNRIKATAAIQDTLNTNVTWLTTHPLQPGEDFKFRIGSHFNPIMRGPRPVSRMFDLRNDVEYNGLWHSHIM
jgi:sulfate adenylyltransferase subunit 1 (EFTu-like GTPase family)